MQKFLSLSRRPEIYILKQRNFLLTSGGTSTTFYITTHCAFLITILSRRKKVFFTKRKIISTLAFSQFYYMINFAKVLLHDRALILLSRRGKSEHHRDNITGNTRRSRSKQTKPRIEKVPQRQY